MKNFNLEKFISKYIWLKNRDYMRKYIEIHFRFPNVYMFNTQNKKLFNVYNTLEQKLNFIEIRNLNRNIESRLEVKNSYLFKIETLFEDILSIIHFELSYLNKRKLYQNIVFIRKNKDSIKVKLKEYTLIYTLSKEKNSEKVVIKIKYKLNGYTFTTYSPIYFHSESIKMNNYDKEKLMEIILYPLNTQNSLNKVLLTFELLYKYRKEVFTSLKYKFKLVSLKKNIQFNKPINYLDTIMSNKIIDKQFLQIVSWESELARNKFFDTNIYFVIKVDEIDSIYLYNDLIGYSDFPISLETINPSSLIELLNSFISKLRTTSSQIFEFNSK